jgi:hypothetical protein
MARSPVSTTAAAVPITRIPYDTLDTVDTLAASPWPEPQSVKSVQSVRGASTARRVYMVGTGLAARSHLGFAYLADGFWSGLLMRALVGVG